MNPNIILAGRSPDFAGSMARGTDLAVRQNEAQRGNALAQLYQTQGPGIAAGDPGALNALAQFDPMAAQQSRMAMEDQKFRREDMQMRREDRTANMAMERERLQIARDAAKRAGDEWARTLTEQQRADYAQKLEDGLARAVPYFKAGDAAGFARAIEAEGLDAAEITIESFPEFAAKVKGLAEAMKPVEPADEYGRYVAEETAAGRQPLDRIGYAQAKSKGTGTTVNIDQGGGKFEEAFAKGDAETLGSVYNLGLAATRNIGRIDQLAQLLQTAPAGAAGVWTQLLGEWGINSEGLDGVQAAQAAINALVPEQRQPGSGPMSDADLALFKQSLPRIINQPGGNEIIVATMRAIAEYDAQGAAIVQQLRAGQIDRPTAFNMLQERKNPLDDFIAGRPPVAGSPPPATGAQPGVTDDPLGLFTP